MAGCKWAKAAAEAGLTAALAALPSPVSEEEETEVAKCGHLCIARYHSMAERGDDIDDDDDALIIRHGAMGGDDDESHAAVAALIGGTAAGEAGSNSPRSSRGIF